MSGLDMTMRVERRIDDLSEPGVSAVVDCVGWADLVRHEIGEFFILVLGECLGGVQIERASRAVVHQGL